VLTAAGCCKPELVTKTVTERVEVPKIVAVPAELTADCAPAPLKDRTLGSVLDRLSSVELALAQCRDQLGKIRALKP
jgi:hypothetical protein